MDCLQVVLDLRVTVDGDSDGQSVPYEPDGYSYIAGLVFTERDVGRDHQVFDLFPTVATESFYRTADVLQGAAQRRPELRPLLGLGAWHHVGPSEGICCRCHSRISGKASCSTPSIFRPDNFLPTFCMCQPSPPTRHPVSGGNTVPPLTAPPPPPLR